MTWMRVAYQWFWWIPSVKSYDLALTTSKAKEERGASQSFVPTGLSILVSTRCACVKTAPLAHLPERSFPKCASSTVFLLLFSLCLSNVMCMFATYNLLLLTIAFLWDVNRDGSRPIIDFSSSKKFNSAGISSAAAKAEYVQSRELNNGMNIHIPPGASSSSGIHPTTAPPPRSYFPGLPGMLHSSVLKEISLDSPICEYLGDLPLTTLQAITKNTIVEI